MGVLLLSISLIFTDKSNQPSFFMPPLTIPHLLKLTRYPFIILFLLLPYSQIHAQEINVTIRLTDDKDEPVPFANFQVMKREDTLKVQKKAGDNSGKANFILLKDVQYIVRITVANYIPMEKGITVTGDHPVFSFITQPISKSLSVVEVKTIKPLMRQEDDKTIIDPESLAAASTNGYEVIEKTPGLFVDQDGNIYISSLSPATVQINGRDMKMSAADIATLLKSLPPDAISKIEIVRTPSAKYDATSSGGIVNVVLKKGIKIGITGSINTGIQQGTYGNQFMGINLNNNDGKKSSYINLNYSRRNSFEKIITDRLFAPDSMLSQNSVTKYPANTYFANYGMTLPAGKRWEIDFSTSMHLNDYKNSSANQNVIKKISTSQTSDNQNWVKNDGSSFNLRNGVSGKQKINTIGSEWSNDIFFNYSQNKSEQVFATFYYTPWLVIEGGDGTSDNRRNYFNMQSDLKLKMKKKFTFETGAKSTILNYKSVTNFYNYKEPGGNRVKDSIRTNTFHYDENINSLYLQGSKTFSKDIILKVGARLENTNMKGRQKIPADTSFNIQRTDLFPFIYLSKNILKIAGYDLRAYLVYRRTINRPVYEQLNPFPRYVDQYLSEVGNPSLRPQFTQNYEANISVNERPILAVGVNDTKDIFTNVIYPDTNVTYPSGSTRIHANRTFDNLGKRKEVYFRGLGAIPPGKKYFFVIGTQYNHNNYQGLYENKPLSFKKGSWSFFTYQSFKIDKRSQITLNGFMRLRGQLQFYELSPFGALNTSINRQFLKQKLTVTISVNDIFYSNKNDFTINQGSVSASGHRLADTRRFGLNVRYNFGIKKKEEKNEFLNMDSPDKVN